MSFEDIPRQGIFITPSSVWRLAQSPGSALMLWIAGGFIRSGEQKYLEETFDEKKEEKNIGHIFSFVMTTIILPGAIIADSYACSKYILYAIKGNDGNENIYFGIDYLELRLLAIVILLSVTVYHSYSNKLAIIINQTFAVIKTLALLILSIIGLAWLRENSSKDHWIGIFNNTPSDDVHERSVSEQIGCYGYAMLEVNI
ncbi:45994_t:CDS:2 [Gigaspora margarita]|uniref:45994_t:CDS:1 n=1 Tax=Gigaspora margarita TaxID=4874 RepID=A0ABM8VZN2_GIGMA|nr:45994_t:CDS:2 [Gigaspora margarita]